MKNILIAIYGLGCGGAEKSLLSFLNALPKDRWNIDLLVASPHGMYMNQIPDYVHVLSGEYELENVTTRFRDRRKKICGANDLLNQINWILHSRLLKSGGHLNHEERRWKIWGRRIPRLKKEYDLALSYIGGTNYYVIDKVTARKKVLWIHNEFEKLGYNYEFERPYYEKADRIVTISQACVESLLNVYPDFKDKTLVLENISSKETIQRLAQLKPEGDPYFSCTGIKILSIGRLMEQKGFDCAIDAARLLKKKGVPFLWYILGEGELRSRLQSQIDRYGLENECKLIGIRENPYPYISACDIFAQTSRYEGKSIALDEAKILCRPILLTNYATAKASVQDGYNGIITEMTPEAVADGLAELSLNPKLRQELTGRLQSETNSNEKEIERYIALIDMLLEE